MLASFGQRFQRLLGELLDPMFGFGFVEIMIEELPWVCDKIGEPSVVIAVASPHRAEAFDACRYAIDRIKEIVPIWKKEAYEGGETWIGSEAAYQEQFGHSMPRD